MDIIRQGKTETALLSSTNREEIETSIPTVTLMKNDDVRLDDVDEKSILHDILFGRGFLTAGTGGATIATDGSSSAPMGKKGFVSSSDPPVPVSSSAIGNGVDGRSPSLRRTIISEVSLHAICEDSKTIPEFLERASANLSTREAGSQDGEGRTPLHCLSLNSSLARGTLTREQKLLLENADDAAVNNKKDGAHSAGIGLNGKAKPHQPISGANRTMYPELLATYSEESTNSLEQDLVDFIITELWRAYRPAMITPDRYGKKAESRSVYKLSCCTTVLTIFSA
jgi:hypothetical protein